jgi:hypothetical protein
LLFADRRPIFIQSIPYMFAASVFLILVGTLTRRAPDAATWPLRLLMLLSLLTAAACINFIWSNGTLYVCINPSPSSSKACANVNRSTGPSSTVCPHRLKLTKRNFPKYRKTLSWARWWARSTSEEKAMQGYWVWRRARRGSSRVRVGDWLVAFLVEL